jgi:hypothetical protein
MESPANVPLQPSKPTAPAATRGARKWLVLPPMICNPRAFPRRSGATAEDINVEAEGW